MHITPRWKERIGLGLVLLLMAILLLREMRNPHLGYPDGDRYLMDGVFLFDFLHDMPLTRIYDFTVSYYAQYPAIDIGYHMPFFPFVEAVFHIIFGINMWSSRLTIVFFLSIGVLALFKLVKSTFDLTTAFWSSMLLVTTPFVIQWGWYTMSEIPLLAMSMLTLYVFSRFTETWRPSYLYAAAIILSLTLWTKQTGAFLILTLVGDLMVKGQFITLMKRKEMWITCLILLVLLTPLAFITIWFGNQNLAQSLTSTEYSEISWTNLTDYIDLLVKEQLTWPVAILAVTGIAWACWKRDSRTVYFALLIVSVYLFFTTIRCLRMARFTIAWIPAFCVFAALPAAYLRKSKIASSAAVVVLTAVVSYQIGCVYALSPYYATGYDEAACYILRANKIPMVFFDGYNDGYFTFFMRAFDPDKSMYVLRGDKLLSSSSIWTGHWLTVHAHVAEDIKTIFDKYGIVYIVVESENWSSVEIHQTLRNFLKTEVFELVQEIPLKTNRKELLQSKTLKIYKYLEAKPITANYIELNLPVVGKTLKVPLRKIP